MQNANFKSLPINYSVRSYFLIAYCNFNKTLGAIKIYVNIARR
jgi:hypothetical protein